jgi:hypothetical protein
VGIDSDGKGSKHRREGHDVRPNQARLWQESGTAKEGRGRRRDKEGKESGGKEGETIKMTRYV